MASRLQWCDFTDSNFLRFQISPEWCGRRTFDELSEWNVRFQIPPASRGGGLRQCWRICRFKLHRQFQYSSTYFNLFNNLSSFVHFSQRQGLISYHRERNTCKENGHFMIIDLKRIVKQFTRMWNSRANNLTVVLVTLLFCHILVVLLHFHNRLHGIFTCTWIFFFFFFCNSL